MGALSHKHSKNPTDPRSFPPEIVEMIIAHLEHDIPTLKACAATCFCWYNIAVPRLHRTLILEARDFGKHQNRHPNPLPSLFKLGLLPFVQQLQFRGVVPMWDQWIVPAVFESRNMQYFRAMVNLQELKIGNLDLSLFLAGLRQYWGHFSPTLRSVALSHPNGTRRRLLDSFRLFPKLDDIEIVHYRPMSEAHEPLDSRLIPIGGGYEVD